MRRVFRGQNFEQPKNFIGSLNRDFEFHVIAPSFVERDMENINGTKNVTLALFHPQGSWKIPTHSLLLFETLFFIHLGLLRD